MSIIARLGLATFLVCLAAVNVAGQQPQATQKKETVAKGSEATTTQLRGELIAVGPNWLVARMVPGGDYRFFDVKPGAVATIEGTKKQLSQLRLGTMLTAAVTTKETQMVKRGRRRSPKADCSGRVPRPLSWPWKTAPTGSTPCRPASSSRWKASSWASRNFAPA